MSPRPTTRRGGARALLAPLLAAPLLLTSCATVSQVGRECEKVITDPRFQQTLLLAALLHEAEHGRPGSGFKVGPPEKWKVRR